MNALTKSPEYLVWSYTTILLCVAGWLTHWLMSWGKSWKRDRKGFVDFIDDNPPAFWLSIVATAALYAIGPFVLDIIGIHLASIPGASAAVIANAGAYVLGFGADWLVYGIATLVRRATGTPDDRD